MTPRARAIIREVAEQHGVPFERIVKSGRVQKVFRARMAAAIRLSAETRYSSPQIGKLLGCDHTMVLFYLGRLKKKPSQPRPPRPPRWKAPRVKTLWIKPEPPPKYRGPTRYAGFDPREKQFNRHRHTTNEERA